MRVGEMVFVSAGGEPSARSTEIGINSCNRGDRSPKRQKYPLISDSEIKGMVNNCSSLITLHIFLMSLSSFLILP